MYQQPVTLSGLPQKDEEFLKDGTLVYTTKGAPSPHEVKVLPLKNSPVFAIAETSFSP
jgi:hypothetical protein